MKQFLFDILTFFFPKYCPVCKKLIYNKEETLCFTCEMGLPRTAYSREEENPLSKIFWGRCDISAATALIRFEKGSAYQQLLHELKYRGVTQIGFYAGKLMGQDIRNSPFADIDFIIPVPLHRRKKRQRGYNQSELLARGISEIIKKPVKTDILERHVFTKSQTKKNRLERWNNMEGVFRLKKGIGGLENCKILLVDDVLTTGATLEVAAAELLKIEGVKVFVACFACA